MTKRTPCPLAYKLLYSFILIVPMVTLWNLEAEHKTARNLDQNYGLINGTGSLVFFGAVMATGVGSVLSAATIEAKRWG